MKSQYDSCPECGGRKQRPSLRCSRCALRARGEVRPILVQPEDPTYRLIPLTQGKIAKVETTEYANLCQWKWSARKMRKGHEGYYALRNSVPVNGKRKIIFMHRVILGLTEGDKRHSDHALHDTLDNRRFVDGKENLRIATAAENQQNKAKPRCGSNRLKGVDFMRSEGKWRARIAANGKSHFLGLFVNETDAYEAYRNAAKTLHGKFAWFPEAPTQGGEQECA